MVRARTGASDISIMVLISFCLKVVIMLPTKYITTLDGDAISSKPHLIDHCVPYFLIPLGGPISLCYLIIVI